MEAKHSGILLGILVCVLVWADVWTAAIVPEDGMYQLGRGDMVLPLLGYPMLWATYNACTRIVTICLCLAIYVFIL